MAVNEVIFISFADNKIPEFREYKSKDWISFGEDNIFPEHLLYLFNKSSNHNAIVDGKVKYIIGGGLSDKTVVNSHGETFNKVLTKFCFDIELSGGAYFEILWKIGGKAEIKHVPFQYLRKDKEGRGWWYSKNWNPRKGKKAEPVFIPKFHPDKKIGAQIFSYAEYRPGCDEYPLPGYFGALNDIETDVEISKYNLSVIKQGMFSSKMIIFNNGTPTDEAKRKLEKAFKDKFAGSDNAGRFMLVFNDDPTKAPTVQDLSTTDLDKLFDQLNKTTQAEIFSGHQVTSPMLFGIMEPGKLGGRNEIRDAYEIFKNTYVNNKQQNLEEVVEYLAQFIGLQPEKLKPVEPIGFDINPVDFKEMLPKEWILEKIGIDPFDYPELNVSGTPTVGLVNENLKNLTGRQQQNIDRIIRKYKTGRIAKPMAETMLRSGLGLSDEEISTFLNFALIEAEDEVAEMFSEVGLPRETYVVLKSKLKFEDIGANDSDIINLIGKDKRITPAVIAKAIHKKPEYVSARIKALTESGVLTSSIETIGIDTIIEHTINPEQIDSRVPPETADVYIRYSYEPKPGLEPIIETTRPFCKKLIDLDKLYTRAEIEGISQRVGYSVFDRKGGFWGDKQECRHRWVSNIVIKKKK